jgi:hypothetical protein
MTLLRESSPKLATVYVVSVSQDPKRRVACARCDNFTWNMLRSVDHFGSAIGVAAVIGPPERLKEEDKFFRKHH